MKWFLSACICCSAFIATAQDAVEKISLTATRSTAPIKIDGKLSEKDWEEGFTDTEFKQIEPNAGASSAHKSAIKVIYDDNAIYVGARLYDVSPDSVLRELTARDNIGNTDWFGVFVDAYKDGINGVGFICSAGGVQSDFKYSVLGEDVSWNTVWQSEQELVEKGWTVEFRIPYSALRFPQKDTQQWHINFLRYIRRTREKSSWSYVNPTVSGFFNQAGLVNGIQGIKPPLRLQVFPYMSAYYTRFGKESATAFNGGMDVKYGLNDAYTLDMTLIPDFGQVQSDNRVLNLSPVEVRFQENRQFFTEGIELFNKGDLFYSRRIGQTPIGYNSAYNETKSGEKVVENPTEARLYNATKVSGRDKNGLGIGVFNAVSRPTYATLEDSIGNRRKVLTSPLTNYNVLVFDQNLKNNSYVTLINTNVTRDGSFYDANVTGTEFNLRNKNISYAISGGGAYSQQFGKNGEDIKGFAQKLELAKISGNFTWYAGYSIRSNTFNPNDMGYLGLNNTIDKYISLNYNTYVPKGWYNKKGTSFYINHTDIYKPREFSNFSYGIEQFFVTRAFHGFGGYFYNEPIVTYDYFEPRSPGRFYTYPTNFTIGGWISTDYRKKFAFDISVNYRRFNEPGRYNFTYNISPRYRVNNKLSFIYSYNREYQNNDVGYALFNDLGYSAQDDGSLQIPDGQITFGIRNRVTHTNLLTVKYTFTNKSGLNFRLRHYWSKVLYNGVYELNDRGHLVPTTYTGRNADRLSYHDDSYNAFNIDMVYSWVFSPGSQLSIVWKNSIYTSEARPYQRFDDNLNNVLNQTQTNSFSVKLLYFFDYQYLMKRRS